VAAAAGRDFICYSGELVDGGCGVRFAVWWHGAVAPAFAVRFGGVVHAYLNRCGHRSLELDWNAGEFFDARGEHLLCATHGARYTPATGACIEGPCRGEGLIKLAVVERDGAVRLAPADEVHLAMSEAGT
jgi:nitrite reductase/ring-hydroxylating ferredoxin subunit